MRCLLFSAAALLALTACSDSTASGGAGPPARLDIVAGDLQPQAVAGAELPEPLVVKVVDDKGKAMKGQLVNWVVTAGSGHVFAGSSLTNANGEARERWTLGPVAGDTQRVEARAVHAATGQAQVFGTFREVGQPGPAAALSILGGSGQQSEPGATLPAQLVVRVMDANHNGVANAPLAWAATAGTGTLVADAKTDATGTGRATWTLGPENAQQRVRVTSGTLAAVELTASIAPPGIPGLVVVSGNGQMGPGGQPLPAPLRLQLRGANGRPLAGAWIKRLPNSGGGNPISPDSALTDAQGMVSFTWTLPRTSGGVQLVFVAPATAATANAYASAQVGAAASVRFKTAWDSTYYYKPQAFVIVELEILDAAGNPTETGVTYAVEAGGGSVLAGSTFQWTLGSAPGPQRVRVTAGSSSLVVATQALTVYANVFGPPVVTNDTLYVRSSTSDDDRAAAETPPPGVTLTLTVDGRTVPMTYRWQPGSKGPFRGNLPLMGLAHGEKTGRLDFTSPTGTFSRTFTFTY